MIQYPILGKILGFLSGYLLFGPLGAFFGVFIGHQFDRGSIRTGALPHTKQVFFETTFTVMGHLAKADGRVSAHEIKLAETTMHRMNLSKQQRQQAMNFFRQGKQTSFNLEDALHRLNNQCRNRILLRMFVEIQFQAAIADGALNNFKKNILLKICITLGFEELFQQFTQGSYSSQRQSSYSRSRQHYQRPRTETELQRAYATLGVKPEADKPTTKRAYRKLMSANHPDKLVSKGLPDEMMKIATEKTQQIQLAYDLVCKVRGF